MVAEVIAHYEKQTSDFVDKWYEDNRVLEVPGYPPVAGKESLKAHYAWLFKGADQISFTVHAITILPGQVHITLKATIVNTHKVIEPTYTMIVEKGLKSSKVKSLKLSGEGVPHAFDTIGLAAGPTVPGLTVTARGLN
ncbi:hypothetical protein CC1G_02113 [Coprinopsis cinerea okayama7|uniref:SnoaL-like domain-containing protein n=1 Tax=Coprinopsis cinerea (strain Okayama-7 / 130 / ATCC MYA-4618 / FGSC 9003) TaxID=240176 RepID=A8NK85_COPC7|nr:hypothetical protein CC1G_02113 [Coprinopsis cinerea okayama7\|eukprot:XP_001834377.2 hypothetical protein CC1G_02113 [Coprinopsis cinerea okayama7\